MENDLIEIAQDKFYIFTGDGFVESRNAQLVSSPLLPSIELFAREAGSFEKEDGKIWIISESRTGLKVPGGQGNTLEEAISNMEKHIIALYAKEISKKMEAEVERNGLSPRFRVKQC